MKKAQIVFVLTIIVFSGFKADKPAYSLFDIEGKSVKYKKMLNELANADVVLFGELHNNPISHWLQLELSKDLFDINKENLILGAEMFETDNQLLIDEFINGVITTSRFEAEARLWPNYKNDYKPLVEFAKDSGLQVIATNIPRRYASVVNSDGFEGLEELSDEAKKYLPPLPVAYDSTLSCYKSLLGMGNGMGPHITPNFPKAQAIKDATMAHFIVKNWEDGNLFLHFNGAYHSDNFESINWYLKQAMPGLKILTITTVSQKNVNELNEDNLGKADYTICVVDNMTTTY